ncbi:MAG: DNA repair exonuclease [Clostridia bacterium]|nr:DNA repair exonuclease [Clostridia bacterium]
MRFVHMADIHLDSPFRVLALEKDLADKRRLQQREAFRRGIEYVKRENIPFLFISGDLYEQEYIRESTIEFVNNLFKEIPNTKIFISPGNHDPYLANSFYNTFNWNENVTIFNDEIKRIELDEADIYGYGFSDFYCTNSGCDEIEIKNKEKINILIVHGSLDASKTQDLQYNPINSAKLKKIGFDYVALGHIHKSNFNNNENNFIYPGSLISFGFDELGEHGILDVKINKNNLIKNNENNFKLNNNLELKNKLEKNKINNL